MKPSSKAILPCLLSILVLSACKDKESDNNNYNCSGKTVHQLVYDDEWPANIINEFNNAFSPTAYIYADSHNVEIDNKLLINVRIDNDSAFLVPDSSILYEQHRFKVLVPCILVLDANGNKQFFANGGYMELWVSNKSYIGSKLAKGQCYRAYCGLFENRDSRKMVYKSHFDFSY